MADHTTERILAQLASLQEQVARQEVALRRSIARRPRRPILALLAVALFVALVPLSVLAATPFTDLIPDGPHNANIEAIADAGITKGCDPTHYCPKGTVTREEMASFLARLGGLGTNPPVANARVLQGYEPSALVRAARGRQDSNFTSLPHGGVGAPPVTLASVTLVAPGPGFVLLSGTFNASREATNGFAPIEYRLLDAAGGEAAPHQVFTLGPGVNNLAGSATTVIAVPAAGARFYSLEVRNVSNDTNAFGLGGEITALYVPFDGAGQSAKP